MVKSNDKVVFSAINRGKNITIFFTGKIQQKLKYARVANQGFYTSLKMDSMNAENVTFVSTLRTNTYLKHSRAALDIWYELIWWFLYGFTANRTAKETEVSQKLVHRCFIIIRKALYEYEEENIKPVFGTVEIDETYVGPKFKNRRKTQVL